MRFLCRCTSVLFLSLVLLAPAAHGQAAPAPQTDTSGDDKPVRVPALQYTVAFLLTMLILVIVCMPSRKGTQED